MELSTFLLDTVNAAALLVIFFVLYKSQIGFKFVS